MKKNIIVLTKSKKHSGYCIAGVDYKTGEWIRLISSDIKTEGAVPEEYLQLLGGGILEVYDIIECDLVQSCSTSIQPENWLYNENVKWKKVGKSDLEQVIEIHGYDTPRYIFENNDVKLSGDWVFKEAASLYLTKVQNAKFWVKTFNGEQTVSLNFKYNGEDYKYMRVSEIGIKNYFKNMRDGSYPVKSTTMVFSLTDRYYYNGKYYKVVAQILD